VVVIGYRRPGHLRRTITSFLEVNTYPHVELILADDGSPRRMQEEMRELPFHKFAFSDRNGGLGANSNRGLRAASGDFVLQLQDDWNCRGPGGFLEAAIEVSQERPELGFLRLTDPQPEVTYQVWRSSGGRTVRIYDFAQPFADPYLYTDQPHLKSRAALERLGPYRESRYTALCEMDMRDRFNAQREIRAAFVEGFDAFEHIGSDLSFNRPLPHARIGMLMDRSPGLRSLARLYRRLRAGGKPEATGR